MATKTWDGPVSPVEAVMDAKARAAILALAWEALEDEGGEYDLAADALDRQCATAERSGRIDDAEACRIAAGHLRYEIAESLDLACRIARSIARLRPDWTYADAQAAAKRNFEYQVNPAACRDAYLRTWREVRGD